MTASAFRPLKNAWRRAALIFASALMGLTSACGREERPEVVAATLQIRAPEVVYGARAFPIELSGIQPGDTVRQHVFSHTRQPSRLSHSVTEYIAPDSGRINTSTRAPVGFDFPSTRRVFWRRFAVRSSDAPFAAIREQVDWPSTHWLIVAESPARVGWTLVEVAPMQNDPELHVEPIDAAGMAGWRLAPRTAPGPLIILLGGADGTQMFAMAQALAGRGLTAVTLNWRDAMAPGRCLGRLDFDRLNDAIGAVLDESELPSGEFALFGFSHGQLLALLYGEHGEQDPGLITTASGTDIVGHGEGGPFCLLPDTHLQIDGAPAAQINWWGPGPLAIWRYAATRLEWMTQAEANRAALERTSPERLAAARVQPPGPEIAFLAAAGERDSVAPAASIARPLCQRPQDCLIFPDAEHELLWTGVSPMGCDWMSEETCEATGQAQALLMEAIIERAYAVLGVPGGFATPYAPGEAPAGFEP